MKKIISIILLLVFALSLCACGESHDTERFAGTWKSEKGDATLILREDGTATYIQDKVLVDADGNIILDKEGNPEKDPSNGEYSFLWTADSNSAITIKWDGEPVPALPSQITEEKTDATTDVVTDVTTDVETTEPLTEVIEGEEEVAPATDTTEPVVNGETSNATQKRDDPSVVGYGTMALIDGKLVLYLSEGSSTDILLFVFNAINKNPMHYVEAE